jgi:hypothetical protein
MVVSEVEAIGIAIQSTNETVSEASSGGELRLSWTYMLSV